jgi:hypothetical protein
VDKGHGRREVRSIRTTTVLTKGQDWEGLKQGFEVTRERTEKGKTTVEVVDGITSLRPEEADAARLLGGVRDHWRSENCLHYVRDVTLGGGRLPGAQGVGAAGAGGAAQRGGPPAGRGGGRDTVYADTREAVFGPRVARSSRAIPFCHKLICRWPLCRHFPILGGPAIAPEDPP